ncbi:hypothetical protein DRQ09_07810 [candidate division KSB1 bacterium]|nr:MAG: hypothetical protein DRQ09_07810 [candidate division KSB1 bacterium]
MTEEKIQFEDLVSSSDIVLSKPGYGIISDCIANKTPLVHIQRWDFLETDILVKDLNKYIPSVYMPYEDFINGNWELYFDKVINDELRNRKNMEINGGAIVSSYLLDYIKDNS